MENDEAKNNEIFHGKLIGTKWLLNLFFLASMFSMFSVIGSCGNEAVAGMGTNAGAGRADLRHQKGL